MLGDTSWQEVDELGRTLRAGWAAFARTGRPGAAVAPLVCGEVRVPLR
ncbi:hypothetical protein NKH18_39045 [Streptomyces sp. M10(2022)]